MFLQRHVCALRANIVQVIFWCNVVETSFGGTWRNLVFNQRFIAIYHRLSWIVVSCIIYTSIWPMYYISPITFNSCAWRPTHTKISDEYVIKIRCLRTLFSHTRIWCSLVLNQCIKRYIYSLSSIAVSRGLSKQWICY